MSARAAAWAGAWALLSAWIFGVAAAEPERGAWRDSLVILHTNDTHAWLMPFKREDGTFAGGAAARASLTRRERSSPARTLLLDAGDVFQGTPYFNFFRGIPDYRAMSLMGYDAGALGNHDLDDGPLAWLRASAEARFEIMSANVFVAAESSWAAGRDTVPLELRRGARWVGGARVPDEAPLRFLARPSLTKDLGAGLTAALFGLTTDELTHIVSVTPNGGVAVANPVAAAKRLVPELRRTADVVICVSHLGTQKDRELAERVPGIDVIIGGHSHTRLHRPILVRNGTENGYRGTVIAQAGHRGEFLGRTVLYLESERAAGFYGALLPVRPEEGEDAQVTALLQPYADSIAAAMSRTVFHSPARVPADGLRDGESPLGNFAADVIREETGADLALINSGGIRAALPAGAVTVGDVYTILPFDNRLVVATMPGWQVRELLDFVARRLGKGGFAQVSGVSFVIRAGRASTIRVGGKPLDSDRFYRLGTVDFLTGGGDGYAIFARAAKLEGTDLFIRDAALRFLAKNPDYKFRKESRISWEGSTPALRDLRTR